MRKRTRVIHSGIWLAGVALNALPARAQAAQGQAAPVQTQPQAQPPPPAQEVLSLDDILNLTVETASKKKESAREAPATINVITDDEIRAYGARNVADLLERLPGLHMIDTYWIRNNLLSVRGNQPTSHYNVHVLVLLDGRPTRDSVLGGINVPYFQSFPVERVQRIEVIRGPGSVLFGTGAYAGVVNIITYKGAAQATLARVRGGSFGGRGAATAFGGAWGDLEASGGVNFFENDGWPYESKDQKFITKRIAAKEKSVGAQARLDWGDWRLNSFVGTALNHTMGISSAWREGHGLSNDALKAHADLGYEHEFDDHWRLQANLTYNRMRSHTPLIGAQADDLSAFSDDLLAEATLHFNEGDWGLLIGTLANYQTGKYLWPQLQADGRTAFNTFHGPNPAPWVAISPYYETWEAAYFQTEYRVVKSLKLVAGAQYNKSPSLAGDFVPRLGFISPLSSTLTAKVFYGGAFRSANFFERHLKALGILMGEDQLKPEKVTTVEASLSYAHRRHELTGTVHHSSERDIIARSRADERLAVWNGQNEAWPKQVNRGTVRTTGLELEGRTPLAEDWSLQGSYSFYTNHDDTGLKQVYGIPQHLAKLGVDARWPSAGLRVGLFDSQLSRPPITWKLASHGDNPRAAMNVLTLNVGADLNHWLKLESATHWALDLYAHNMFGAQLSSVEHIRKFIDTVPAGPRASFYAQLTGTF
jgi:outer membrane receptor for ferrienterochelin and colicins